MEIIFQFSNEQFNAVITSLPFPKKSEVINKKLSQTVDKKEAFVDEIFWFDDFVKVHNWTLVCLDMLRQIRFGLAYAICYYDFKLSPLIQPEQFINSNDRFVFYYFIDNCVYRISTVLDRVGQLFNELSGLGLEEKEVSFSCVVDLLNKDEKIQHANLVKRINRRINGSRWTNIKELKEYRNSFTHRMEPKFQGYTSETKDGVTTFFNKKNPYDITTLKTLVLESYKMVVEIIELVIDEAYKVSR